MDYQALKQRHRAERADFHANLTLRVHRALSWLQRAEMAEDEDGRFIFLWIAFNAAYATEIPDAYKGSEQDTFRVFIQKLQGLDAGRQLDALVWKEFTQSIRVLLANPYVFQDFWFCLKDGTEKQGWTRRFESAGRAASAAVARGETDVVLSIVLSRIYTLRNQLMHGGATWNSKVNRDQLRDCVKLLGKLVPLIIQIMMDNPKALWGDPLYPVIEQQ
jgi:hypothetical protein